jgi:hypothetical protein
MMESAGEVLFFASSFALLNKCKLPFPRSDLSRHHPNANFATHDTCLKHLLRARPFGLVLPAVGRQCPHDSRHFVRQGGE